MALEKKKSADEWGVAFEGTEAPGGGTPIILLSQRSRGWDKTLAFLG